VNYYPTPGVEYVRVSVAFARQLLGLPWWDSSPLLHPTYRESDGTIVIPAAWLARRLDGAR
jgi:hypothetical protein